MINHTPGPWSYAYSDSDRIYFTVFSPYERREVVGEYGIEKSADAKLISAAPDLLEALIWADHVLRVNNVIEVASDASPGSLASKMKSAIAKATGE